MAETKLVLARIDVNANPKTVTFKGEDGLPPGVTFHVRQNDKVLWQLQNASGTPTAFAVQVIFSPSTGEALFKNQQIFKAVGNKITSAAVNPLAPQTDPSKPPVRYSYRFVLESPPGTFTDLRCFWTDGPNTIDAPMGGGEKGGGPR